MYHWSHKPLAYVIQAQPYPDVLLKPLTPRIAYAVQTHCLHFLQTIQVYILGGTVQWVQAHI